MRPAKNAYDGKIYILVNGLTISGASHIAAIASFLKRAIIIGEETGGAYHGGSSGDFIILTLPNSRLKVRLPIRQYTENLDPKYPWCSGVIPDYEVPTTITSILENRDEQLKFALKLIQKK